MALGNSASSEYAALFRNYLKRATRSALQPTPQDTFPQSGGYERTSQLIHTLTFALQGNELWSEARELLFSLGETLERTARHTDLIALLEKGLQRSAEVEDAETQALIQSRLGDLLSTQGETDRAHALLTAAAAYFAAHNNPLHHGEALNGLARWAIQRGDLDDATELTQQALALLPPETYDERAMSYRMLGNIALDQKAWHNAHAAFSESLNLWQQGGNSRYIGFGWVNLGAALRGLGQFAEAISAYQEGIRRLETAEDLLNRAIAQNNLGNLYMETARYNEAIEQYHATETVFRHLSRINELARLYNNWGMALAGLARWEQATRAYEQSIAYWTELQNPRRKANTMDNLGLALFALGKYAESATTYRDALSLIEDTDTHDDTLRDVIHNHLAQVNALL